MTSPRPRPQVPSRCGAELGVSVCVCGGGGHSAITLGGLGLQYAFGGTHVHFTASLLAGVLQRRPPPTSGWEGLYRGRVLYLLPRLPAHGPRAGVACEGGGLVCWPDPTSWLVNAASALGMTGLRQVRGFPFLICKRETPAPTCGTVLFWSGEMMVELVKVGGFCHIMGDLIIIYPLPQIIFFLPEGRLWRARCHL